MIKYLPMCLILVAGCVVDAEPESYYDEEETVVDDKPAAPGWGGSTAPNDLGCPGEIVEMPDGSLLQLPGLCAPFYIYTGYPDPTENPYEDVYDPFEGINEEQNQQY